MSTWDQMCNETCQGQLSGNAQHARTCRDTPLEAEAILDLLWDNISYFGDSYYRPITEPVELRVREFYASIERAET